MTIELAWQAFLTLCLFPLGWIMKQALSDLRRIEGDLAEHKTDVAKSYATKSDVIENTRQVMTRFDKLEEKIDRLVERTK